MIAAGRRAIDRAGIARLWGLTWTTAVRLQPWSEFGHPAPIRSGRPVLWDEAQAGAYAAGRPVPVLPSTSDPGDRLDRTEVAERLHVLPRTVSDYVRDGYLPMPDEVHFEVRFWLRATLERLERPGQGTGGGRPPVRARDEAIEPMSERERVLAVLAAAEAPLGEREVARRAEVTRATARKYMTNPP